MYYSQFNIFYLVLIIKINTSIHDKSILAKILFSLIYLFFLIYLNWSSNSVILGHGYKLN
jgi:hypothetical protein